MHFQFKFLTLLLIIAIPIQFLISFYKCQSQFYSLVSFTVSILVLIAISISVQQFHSKLCIKFLFHYILVFGSIKFALLFHLTALDVLSRFNQIYILLYISIPFSFALNIHFSSH